MRTNSWIVSYQTILAGLLALLVSCLAATTTSAATIIWGTAATISADTDVNTNGTALYAYAGGVATTATVNGAAFAAGSGFAAWGNVSFTSGFTASSASAYGVAASPFQDLSSAYTNVLRGGASGGTTAGTVTMNGLTPGHSYTVQIWVNDSRSGSTAARGETINGTAVTLDYNNFDALGGVGQYALGYFTADNTNQSFAMTPNPTSGGSVQLNAISVRDNGLPQRTWLGSTGTIWGTNGNWSPAIAPLPGDAITFNASSTANLATMLDANYTIGTLTLSNAPSAVSIGSDGNTLTVNGGINLFDASQNLAINDALVLGTFQTWTNNGTLTVNAGVSGSAGLTIAGNGVTTFSQPATYLYKTVINGGTLKLSGSATLTSAVITVAGGATFDVSTATSYALNGANLNNGSAGAVLNGTIDCSSGTISLTYDGVNPPFIQTNGTLTLSGGTVINVNNTGAVLGTGNHTLIAAATAGNVGQVTGTLPSVNLTGNGAVGAVSLAINGTGGLDLVVGVADVWTGASDSSWLTGGNWTTAAAPNPGDPVLFNNLSTANLSTVLNADFFLSGVTVINPAGPVMIGGANNLGISASGINMQSASQDLTISAPLQVLADQQWNITNNRTLNINGGVSGGSGLNLVGAGTVNFNSAATYAGNTTVSSNMTLKMTTANVLPNGPGTGDFYFGGLLDLNGFSEAVGGLNGGIGSVVDNTGVGAATLTIGANGGNSTNNGVIRNTGGALALTVAGGNAQLLATNTYSGGTTFNGGTLWFPGTSALGSGPVAFNPGSGSYTAARAFTNVLTLDSCALRVGGGSLSVQNWSGPITITNGFQLSGDSGAGGVTLSGPMNIGTGGITITNSGSNGPNQGNGVSTTGDLLSGVISGAGGITYFCSGASSRLTVQGANTYSGGTIVNGDPASPGGKLNVWGGVNPFSTGSVTLNANAIIEAAPGSATITNALTLNGGTLQSEAQFNNYNTLTWSGPITLTADSALVQFCNSTLNNNQSVGVVVSGSLNMNGFTLTCSCPFDAYNGSIISGSISGAGTILYNGFPNNTLTISGSNTFSGTFRSVVAGKISINNVYALQNATLDMNAADAGAVALNNLNHIIGALTGTRNLALGSGTVSIGNNNTTTTYDGVLSGANLVKLGSGTLTLTALNSLSGNTTVAAGTLSFSQPNFSFGSTVTVSNGAFLNLNAATTNVVTALVLNGVSQPNGVYNSGNTGGRITGTGAIQVGATPDVWTGALSSEWSINILSSPYNWKYNGVIGTNYTDGSAVLFDDTAPAANTNVNISLQNVTPVGVTFNNTNNNYSVSGGFGIAGTAALTKNGPGSVTLFNPNAYTGNTTINGGTVTVASGGSLGTTYPGAITFANGGTLEYSSSSATLSGNITGAGALNFDSSVSGSSLTLSGINAYSGLTTISNTTTGGSRIAAAATSVSPNTTFNIVGAATGGGQLFINGAGTFTNNFTISGVGYKETTGNQAGAIRLSGSDTLTGTITLAGNARIGGILGTGTETISGQITGIGAMDFYIFFLNPSQANTILLANTNLATPNNYNGNTLVENQFNSGSSAGNNTILKLGASEQIPNGPGKGILSFTGYNANRLCTLELNGFNETLNGITNTTAGAFSIIQNTTVGASTLTVGDGNTNSSFSGNITDGGITKSLALTKIGTGTLTLSGIDTYNGGTAINGGTLLINNTSGTGTGTNAVNINSGGTLGGTGFISSLVTNKAGGTLYPGSGGGIGKLTLNGNVTLLAGSTNTFAVNGSTPTNNSVVLGAAVTYGGVLNIVTNGTFTLGQQFKLFTGTGATNAGNFASIAGSPGAGLAFSFTNGVLSVVTASVGPSGPATLTNSISGGTLSLSWPAGQGWRLQMQTNSLSVGLGTNWIYLTDGSLSSTNITVDSTKPTVFYRLTYP